MAKSNKKLRKSLLRVEPLESRLLLATDISMYNDQLPGSLTHVNATGYSVGGSTSGPLVDFASGDPTGAAMTVTESGVRLAGSSQFPAGNTDADLIFGGVIDFTAGNGASLEIDGNDFHQLTYSGLSPNRNYDFSGTAIRGNDGYTNRWSLVTINGADTFTAAHSSGEGIVTSGLNPNQVAVWVGANHNPDQGYVARWTDIDPGSDGIFEIVTTQYTGSIPTSVNAGGVANGSKGYGLSATRLIEFGGLSVSSSVPDDGAVVSGSTTSIRLNFTDEIENASLDVTDLEVDGIPAVAVIPVNLDSAEWFFSGSFAPGMHNVELQADSVSATNGDLAEAFASTFSVALPPAVENTTATGIGATLVTVGADVTSTGFDDPTVEIYWGDNDGGVDAADWDNVLQLGVVGEGVTEQTITELVPNTTYHYRARATNVSGSSWASSTETFSTTEASTSSIVSTSAISVSAFTATATGQVLDTGGDIPTVRVYYGASDAGTNPFGWDNFINIGEQSAGFETLLAGLEPNTEYFYRASAQNISGISWSPVTISLTTSSVAPLVINEIAGGDSDILPTRIRLDSATDFRGEPTTPDWIEIYNPNPVPVNLSGYSLTDDPDNPLKWEFPTGIELGVDEYLVVFASGENLRDPIFDESGRLHTNFSLRNSGEYLAIVGGNEVVLDEYAPEFPRLYEGYTLGLDGSGNDAYFANPTPDAANDDNSIVPGFVGDTEFSLDRGFYDTAITVDITSDTPGATIVYTTDGSNPTLTNGTRVDAPNNSTPPVAPVNISTTTVLRARAYYSDWIETNIDTQTYIYLNDVINQPVQPSGWPTSWGGAPVADYEMDPQITDDPDYAQDLMDGLREIPTFSIVSDLDNFFGSSGIYSNTSNSSLEIVTSAELINPDGTSGFQVEGGLKIQGGGSRNPNNTPKHNFSLRFRDSIDDGKLEYPLFEDSPVERFDSLTLRARYNVSWLHWDEGQRRNGAMIRDQWYRETMLEMGHIDAGRGQFMHMYINGLYWGIYEIHERPDAAHYAEYFGGNEADYDALNGGNPVDGTRSQYNAMQSTVNTRNWSAIQEVLDVDSYIDFTIMQRYGSNRDLKSNGNWRVVGGGLNNVPFRFYSWDSENVFRGVNDGAPSPDPDPINILSTLSQIEEFRLRFADRLHLHFFNDGTLTPEASAQRWMDNVNELYKPIVAESARWGDYRRDAHRRNCGCELYTRDDAWMDETNRLLNTYFPNRTGIVLNQYRGMNLYPNLSAPSFEINGQPQHGGEISLGDVLFIDAPQGEIFYTLDGSDPRAEGGGAVGTLYQPGTGISLLESTTVKARVRNGSTWSALTQTDFVVVPVDGSIFVTEVNYHPQDPTDAEINVIPNLDDDDFEFIEIANLHPQATVNLLGMQFVDGIEFTFPNVSMAPGDRGVIVRNATAFRIRYGNDVNILGEYSGGLSNGGEQLELADALGNRLLNMEYGDDDLWPEAADGVGATLVWSGDVDDDTSLAPGKHFAWTHSTDLGGTPGTANVAKPQIVINEVVNNASDDGVDAIELYNVGDTAVDIGGWNLSDTSDDLFRFEIPSGTTIGAGDFLVFDETQFGFGLNGSEGDDVWLTIPDGTRTVQFVDEVHFGAAFEEFSFGRVPNGEGRLTTTSRNTLGCTNRTAHPSDLVISEVNYSPDEPNAFALALEPTVTSFDLEFVEITNNGLSDLNLTNWQLSGGIEFEFDAGTTITAGEALVVVSFDVADTARLAAFRAQYGISPTARIVGAFSGRLNNAGEAVRLERPDVPVGGLIPRVVVDEVIYDDLPPWAGADANGFSLQRNSAIRSGNDASIWFASLPTAGIATFVNAAPGEFTGDSVVDVVDITLLFDAIARGSNASNFDLDGNGIVDAADRTFMITQIIGTLPGDANLDLTVDVSDFNIWNSNKFGSCSAGWGAGDFNGDGVTDVSDFNIWNNNKFQSAQRPDSAPVIPFEQTTGLSPTVSDAVVGGFSLRTVQPEWLSARKEDSKESDRIDQVFSIMGLE